MVSLQHSALVDPVRAASRDLVRELGFTGASFAGTEFPPSAVHALIEIEKGYATAGEVGKVLKLEKSSVSRLLRKLIVSRMVDENPGTDDERVKLLSLTPLGRERVAAIHAFARAQVSDALAHLRPQQARIVLDGLRLYAGALGQTVPAPVIGIAAGYQPGLVARITQMHALYYTRTSGFGQRFESVVAGGLAEFCGRLDNPQNAIWTVLRDGEIVGSVAIDGEDLGEGIAHLRWFIIDDGMRGTGAGRKLLSAALDFVDARAFVETHLWTFGGLDAARHLYEAYGFSLIEERAGNQWGSEVLEQRFVRARP